MERIRNVDNMYLNGITSVSQVFEEGLIYIFGMAPEYEIKPVSDIDYLFVQWKSGDYSIRAEKPAYYVFKRDN
jgi:hypothetical protein